MSDTQQISDEDRAKFYAIPEWRRNAIADVIRRIVEAEMLKKQNLGNEAEPTKAKPVKRRKA